MSSINNNNNNSTVQICNESKSLTYCNFSLIKNQLNKINETFYLLLSLTNNIKSNNNNNNNKSDYLWHKINLKLNANNNSTRISLPTPEGNDALVRTHSKLI